MRGLRSLFFARFVSAIGDKMFAIALAWWVVSGGVPHYPELTLGLLLATSTLPLALAGPLLGSIVDAVDRRSCMVVSDGGRLILAGLLAYYVHNDELNTPLLFGLCIPLFALGPLFDAAASASLSQFATGPKVLARLVALESAIPNLATALGALFGSWALSLWSFEGAFWFNSVTFLASLALVATLPSLKATSSEKPATGLKKSAGGYSFLKNYPHATRLMILFGVINFFVAPMFLYLPLLTRDVLAGDGADLSLLELAFAMGHLVLFAYFSLRPRLFCRTRWLRFVLVASSALFLWLLGNIERLWPMFVLLFFWGISVAFVTYLAISSFQRLIPDGFKGRFFAMLASVCNMVIPLSFALFGFLSSRYSLQDLIHIGAAGTLVVSFGFLAVPNDDIRHASRQISGPPL